MFLVITMSIEKCPVCGVEIENGSKVNFSAGPYGTRARLRARVCNYVQSPNCINQNEKDIDTLDSNDHSE